MLAVLCHCDLTGLLRKCLVYDEHQPSASTGRDSTEVMVMQSFLMSPVSARYRCSLGSGHMKCDPAWLVSPVFFFFFNN